MTGLIRGGGRKINMLHWTETTERTKMVKISRKQDKAEHCGRYNQQNRKSDQQNKRLNRLREETSTEIVINQTTGHTNSSMTD